MRKLLLALYLLPLAFNANFAQTSTRKPIDLVTNAKKATLPFEAIDLFRVDAAAKKGPDIEKGIEDYTILEIDVDRLQRLEKSRAGTIQLEIPLSFQEDIKLDLVQVDIVSSDFEVIQRSDNKAAKVNAGLHYQGIIHGDDRSIVAISIYPDQVMGLISNEHGNIVLGKTAGISSTQHIAYRDLSVFEEETFSCGTEDSGIGYKRKDIDFKYSTTSRDVGDCVRLYLEVDKDIHDDKGGVQGATDYVTGLMNQVIVLYANENLQAVVSQIVVWNVTSPYSSTSSSGMLADFTANTGSFNGDLGQLLSYQASGGIAYVNGFCRTNTDYRLSFSSIGSTFKIVPTYSWSVMVIAHEFGHLFGSQHTHACVWNGNSTAIDGCAGDTEGSCVLPGNPSQGGTIMSYCHLKSVGINFNEGFGPQPGNVIRNRVANASCLSSCGPPTCEDGIQNGDETGVDCGGSDCPDCPSCDDGIQNGDETGVDCGGPNCAPCPCEGVSVSLSIRLDNYPEETSWEIKSGGSVVANGGTYASAQDGSTITTSLCLPEGCYDFIIYDSFGDGICCSYGSGNYELKDIDNNQVLASGGNFNYSETTNFCVNIGAEPTCEDGIQNGQETGVDCGGPDCPACPCDIPSGLTADPSDESASLRWDDANGADNYDIRARAKGSSAWATGSDLSSPVSFTDLTACTEYEFQVRSNCGDSDSQWSPLFSFSTTGCVVPTCDDGIQNGDETGVDCGGSDCPDCPTCEDGIQNGDETGVDCGGPDCPDCPVVPTCDDGIQNGDETGVDCGGPDCAPCGCQGQTVTLTIQLDKFPQETSWEILSGSTVVSSGGTYGHLPDLSTVTETICLPNGCYDLKFYDSYGDGICCTYGEGYYQLVDDETAATLAAGSNFGSSDTHNFCVGEPEEPSCEDGEQNGDETGIDCGGENCPDCPTEPSCDDGVQNGDETGVDCGGENCPDCPTECTTTLINFNDFNNQWGIWNDGGSDCRRSSIDASYAADGVGSPVRLRDNSSTSHMTTDVLDLSIYEEITVAFSYMTRSMDNSNEDFWLQISTDGGNTFNLVEEWNRGDEFENNQRYEDEVTISGPFTSSVKLRFYCDASTNSDYVYLDNVSISGCTFGANLTAPSTPQTTETFEESKATLEPQQFTVFPNPVQDLLSVRFELPNRMDASLLITDVQGQKIRQVTVKGLEGRIEEQIEVQNYPEGIYLIHLLTTKGRVTKKFIIVK